MENFIKIHRAIGCWIPFVFMIISDELNLNNNIKDFVWLTMLIFNIIILIRTMKIEKINNVYEKIIAIIALILSIGLTIYFVLKIFI